MQKTRLPDSDLPEAGHAENSIIQNQKAAVRFVFDKHRGNRADRLNAAAAGPVWQTGQTDPEDSEEPAAVCPSQLVSGMTELSDFLNLNGLPVTERDLERAFRMMSSSGGDITSDYDTAMVFRTAFCRSREQYEAFPELFRTFLKTRQEAAEQREKKDKIRLQKQQALQEKEKLDIQMTEAERAAEQALQEARQNWNPDVPIDQKDLDHMQTYGKSVSFESPLLQELSKGKQIFSVSKKDVRDGEEELLQKAADALKAGDLKTAQSLKKMMNLLRKYSRAFLDTDAARQRFIDDQTKEAEKKKNQIKRELARIENLMRQAERTQKEIDQRLNELTVLERRDGSLTVKAGSEHHRAQFRTSGGAVYSFGQGVPDWAEKNFTTLSAQEKRDMRQYLKENILQFRTKLTKHIDEMDRAHIDIGATIRGACRTGGIPMLLHYKKPRPGKTDLVLLLDISGSCREASGMMMTFMYLLRSAFPRGSRAFCFVNSLHDVSAIMDAKSDIDTAMRRVLNVIPTRGVYSDYGVPIQMLYDKYLPKITKDTILIVMGDARGNRHDPKIYEFRAMCRKAKRAYWLNTEPVSEWDTADSDASLYGTYADMFETVNPKEIMEFIANGVR